MEDRMLDLFIGTAHAQDGVGSATGQGPDILFMVAIFVAIWYWLIIRPQNKQAKAHSAMVAALKKGDMVVTSSGLHGKIAGVDEKTVLIEGERGIKLKFDKHKVSRTESAGKPGDQSKTDKKKK
jgi:preprotein translocase subunit YajC